MEIFHTFLNAITLLMPVFFAAACTILVGFSRRDSLTCEERKLKNIVIAFLFMVAFGWLGTFGYFFFPEGVFVCLSVPLLAAYLFSAVFLYRIIRFLTRLELPENFPVIHYLAPGLIVALFLIWMFFVPFEVQTELVRSRQLVLPGEYAAYTRLFTSKPLLRVAFLAFYLIHTGVLLMRYYRKANSADSPVHKPAGWVIFLIVLLSIAMFSSMVASFLPRDRVFHYVWALLASFGTSAMYVLLTYHIIRRKYLLYTIRPAATRTDEKREHRIFAGELTRERLENWFREEKPYLNSDLKITDVVKAMDVNRSVISAFINKEYGVNFNRYVNRWRLEEIEQLAVSSGIEKENAAKLYAQAGFGEARQYYRAVRQITN